VAEEAEERREGAAHDRRSDQSRGPRRFPMLALLQRRGAKTASSPRYRPDCGRLDAAGFTPSAA
jgi:hypothetical protein